MIFSYSNWVESRDVISGYSNHAGSGEKVLNTLVNPNCTSRRKATPGHLLCSCSTTEAANVIKCLRSSTVFKANVVFRRFLPARNGIKEIALRATLRAAAMSESPSSHKPSIAQPASAIQARPPLTSNGRRASKYGSQVKATWRCASYIIKCVLAKRRKSFATTQKKRKVRDEDSMEQLIPRLRP